MQCIETISLYFKETSASPTAMPHPSSGFAPKESRLSPNCSWTNEAIDERMDSHHYTWQNQARYLSGEALLCRDSAYFRMPFSIAFKNGGALNPDSIQSGGIKFTSFTHNKINKYIKGRGFHKTHDTFSKMTISDGEVGNALIMGSTSWSSVMQQTHSIIRGFGNQRFHTSRL